jgi:hypothetical protein
MAGAGADRRSYDTGASADVQTNIQSVIGRLEEVIGQRDRQVKAEQGVAGGQEHHSSAEDDAGEERRYGAVDASAGEGRGRQHRLSPSWT